MADAAAPIRYVPYHRLAPDYGITYCRRHINAMGDKGLFPHPHRLSENRVAWTTTDIEYFLATRPQHGEPLPQYWLPRQMAFGRGNAKPHTKVQGRRPGGKVIIGEDGKQRYVVPAENQPGG